MPAPYTVTRNDYHNNPKSNTVYTPRHVSEFLFAILDHPSVRTVLDPAVGRGSLTAPWRASGRTILGCDIDPDSGPSADKFLLGPFEGFTTWPLPRPDLILCNPPFRGAPQGDLYSEVFLRHMVTLFGPAIPIVLFAPMGLRLNQFYKSNRRKWLRDSGLRITSLMSLTRDTFPDVDFHAEVLFFNLPDLNPHYFVPDPPA